MPCTASTPTHVAINNPAPGLGDGRLKLDDRTWGWGLNLGLLYEIDPGTRLGLTWNSQIDLDFKGPAKFSNLGPGLNTVLRNRGTLDADIKVGINVPQQAMASVFTQVNDRWALLGSVGWQQWSKFGRCSWVSKTPPIPVSVTQNLNFKDTWHVALGAQHRLSEPWLLNFGVAYDSGMQSGDVSPLLPVNSAWRFGVGGEQQLSKSTYWGIAAEYLYGGTLDTQLQRRHRWRLAGAAMSSARTTIPALSTLLPTTTGSSSGRSWDGGVCR
jgi:long-chain fatty acid transport protein